MNLHQSYLYHATLVDHHSMMFKRHCNNYNFYAACISYYLWLSHKKEAEKIKQQISITYKSVIA